MTSHIWVTEVLQDLETYLDLNEFPRIKSAVTEARRIAMTELRETVDDPVAEASQRAMSQPVPFKPAPVRDA